MALRPWLVAPGRRLNSPHSFWPISSGGERTIISCVLTPRCVCRSCSRENEGASCWRNAIGNGHQLWPPAKRTDDGQRAKCFLAPCRRFPLERQGSQRWVRCHITGRRVKILAETLGWSLAPEEKVSLDCLITKNWPEVGLETAGRIIHHVLGQHPPKRVLAHLWEDSQL